MRHPTPSRIAAALAQALAFGLGLGGLPWLGTYVIGRDLVGRAVGAVAAGPALIALPLARRGAGLTHSIGARRSGRAP